MTISFHALLAFRTASAIKKLGLACRANAALTDIVKRVERKELQPDPRHITELRLN